MLNHCGNVLRLQRIEDGEEVVSVRHTFLGHLVWEVNPELRIRLPLRQESLDGQLVILGDSDANDLRLLHQLLLVLKYVTEEVFVEHRFGWKVELH